MLVKVTQEHIDSGVRCVAHSCPIARALTELGLKNVTVTTKDFSYDTGLASTIFVRLSKGVARRIRKFDRGEGMEPFAFRAAIDGSVAKRKH